MLLSSEWPYVYLQRDRLIVCSSASSAWLLVDDAFSSQARLFGTLAVRNVTRSSAPASDKHFHVVLILQTVTAMRQRYRLYCVVEMHRTVELYKRYVVGVSIGCIWSLLLRSNGHILRVLYNG